MSPYDEDRVDAYEVVERHWPYDGPYSDELTIAAATMIARLGRYLNNATQKRDGLPYIAVVGRLLGELHGAVAGYEQLLTQLSRYLDREAETNPSVYDDRRDRPGSITAAEVSVDLTIAVDALRNLTADLATAVQGAYHLGSDA